MCFKTARFKRTVQRKMEVFLLFTHLDVQYMTFILHLKTDQKNSCQNGIIMLKLQKPQIIKVIKMTPVSK